MDFYPVLKIVSMISTGAFGILGILTTYRSKEGEITKWGKIAMAGICLSVTVSVVLYGLESSQATASAIKSKKQFEETRHKLDSALYDSARLLRLQSLSLDRSGVLEGKLKGTADRLEAIVRASREIQEKQDRSFLSQEALQQSENRMHVWEIRNSLPLTPLSIHYVESVSMERPEVKDYAERLRRMLENEIKKRPDVDEYGLGGELMPDERTERLADQLLTRGFVSFTFTDGDSREFVSFGCPANNRYLTADFHAGVFRISASCDGLDQMGPYTRLSTMDLIGKVLTWNEVLIQPWDFRSEPPPPIRYVPDLELVNLSFPYAPRNFVRFDLVRNSRFVPLTPENLELAPFVTVTNFLNQAAPTP